MKCCVKKVSVVSGNWKAYEHLEMDSILRVAVALCLVASYAAAQPAQCTENIHCDVGSYCDAFAHCVECIECKNYNRASPAAGSSQTCVMSVFDCGSCLKGYFEDRTSAAFPTCVTTLPRVDGTSSPPDGAVAWQLPVMGVVLAIVVVAAALGIFMFRRSKFITTAMRTSFRASVVNRAAPSAPPQPPPPYNNVVPPATRDKLHHEIEIAANGSAESPVKGYAKRSASAGRPAGPGPGPGAGAGAGSPPPYSPREDAESRRLLAPGSPRREWRRAHAVRNEAAACYNPGVAYTDRPLPAPQQDDENTMPSPWTPDTAENSVDDEYADELRVQEETVPSPWTPAAPNGRVPRNGEPVETEGGAGGGGAAGAPLSLAEQLRRERGTVLLRPPTYPDAAPSERAPPGSGAGPAGGAPPPVAPAPAPAPATADSNIFILINNTNQQLRF